jgi:hypothetical protein
MCFHCGDAAGAVLRLSQVGNNFDKVNLSSLQHMNLQQHEVSIKEEDSGVLDDDDQVIVQDNQRRFAQGGAKFQYREN